MEKIKAFLSKDAVKITIAIIAFAVPLILPVLPPAIKDPASSLWFNVVLPGLVSLGLVSGGTSGLRSNASQAQSAALAEKGVV